MSSVQLELRAGTGANVAAFTGAAGELVVDNTANRLVLQDGTTAGGHPAARLDEVLTNYRHAVSDANYSVLAGDRLISYTSLTAPRVVSLCAASAYPTGTILRIDDETGNCSPTVNLTVNRAGSDTINGQAAAVLATPYAYLALESDGSSKWTIVGQPPGGPSGVLGTAGGGLGAPAKAGVMTFAATGVNANSVADTAIAIVLPTGLTRYRIGRITVLNSSISLTAAQAGVFNAVSGGGVTVAAAQALSGLTTNAANNAGNAIDLTLAIAAATFFTTSSLYFRITTAQGAAATVDVVIEIEPYT